MPRSKEFLDSVEKFAKNLAASPDWSKATVFIERENRGRFPKLAIRIRQDAPAKKIGIRQVKYGRAKQ